MCPPSTYSPVIGEALRRSGVIKNNECTIAEIDAPMPKMRSRRPYVVFDADQHSKPKFWQGEVNIPTELLRTFVAVYELGSFTKAAHLFDLTQPAVSAHMRKLESILGGDLIEKKASGINLTARGEQALKAARRLLAINDELVVTCGTQHPLQGIRLGIPNISAEGLRSVIGAFRRETGHGRIRICCDHSIALLESIRSGYLDLAFLFAEKSEMKDAVTSWSEDLVWVRAPDLVLERGGVVPLISSPNWLLADRRASEALDRAKRRYEIVFSAFDGSSRIAAAAAAVGCMPLPRSHVPASLVIEDSGILPDMGPMTAGVIVREDLDAEQLRPVIAALRAVFCRKTISDQALRTASP
jgi:DNA-binding transcriptional LysR family regulator